jgi:hypothetical protein
MADFSKEWCQRYDEGGMTGDFSVMEIFDKLEEGNYYPIICEGFGFVAVAKRDGICIVAYTTNLETNEVTWINFDEIDEETYLNI